MLNFFSFINRLSYKQKHVSSTLKKRKSLTTPFSSHHRTPCLSAAPRRAVCARCLQLCRPAACATAAALGEVAKWPLLSPHLPDRPPRCPGDPLPRSPPSPRTCPREALPATGSLRPPLTAHVHGHRTRSTPPTRPTLQAPTSCPGPTRRVQTPLLPSPKQLLNHPLPQFPQL